MFALKLEHKAHNNYMNNFNDKASKLYLLFNILATTIPFRSLLPLGLYIALYMSANLPLVIRDSMPIVDEGRTHLLVSLIAMLPYM